MNLLSKGELGLFLASVFQVLPLSYSPLKPAVPAEKRKHIIPSSAGNKLKTMNGVIEIND